MHAMAYDLIDLYPSNVKFLFLNPYSLELHFTISLVNETNTIFICTLFKKLDLGFLIDGNLFPI